MKIAYIISSRKKKGPVVVVRDLVKLFTRNGHECTVYYFDESDEIDFDCPMHQINLKSKVRFSDYDIVHCHGVRPSCFVTLHKPLFSKTCFVTSIHSYIFQDFYFQYGRWKYLFYCLTAFLFVVRFDALIVSSKHAVQYYKRFLPWMPIRYTYNTVTISGESLSPDEIKQIKDFRGHSVLVGCNASLNLRKGQHLLIEAIRDLPNYKLFLLGNGKEEEYYKTLVKQYHLEDRVFFNGFRPNSARFLPMYDIYAMPSFSEGCPLALLEAAAVGCRTVCSNIPVLEEMFSENEAVFFDIKHPATLVDALKQVMQKQDLEKNITARFQRDYSEDAIYQHLYDIYQDQISKK